MGEEYKCDICGAPATVHLTQIVDGKMHKMHLCERCMTRSKVAEIPILKFTEMLAKTLAAKGNEDMRESSETDGAKREAGLKCPVCGMTDVVFEKKQNFGCPNCYEIFSEKIAALLPKIQRGKVYRGDAEKASKRTIGSVSVNKNQSATDIKSRLKKAVLKEDYALAAQLRDELIQLEKKSKKKTAPSAKSKEKKASKTAEKKPRVRKKKTSGGASRE